MIGPPVRSAGRRSLAEEAAELAAGSHPDPFAILGLHGICGGGFAAYCFIPGAEEVAALTLGGEEIGQLWAVGDAGFFAGEVATDERQPLRYRARRGGDSWEVGDPYSFGPVLGPVDDFLIAEGTHRRLFDKLGAHPIVHQGAAGVHFAVWAPNARRVSVVGDFNHWDGRRHAMRRRRDSGVWEMFVPDLTAGATYKFEVVGLNGTRLPLKADPFAFRCELRPATASIVALPPAHEWGDAAHRAFWASADARRQPIAIYEVHAGSWRNRGNGGFLSWDELADRLIPYAADLGFTHIELLPISEYPYDPSWGYQTTGLYAPTARFGEPDGFARFVEGAHRAGLGVLLDWVPAHFPTDAHGLAGFDGTALYEHADPRLGHHPDWHTAIYNFGRREVASYLVNNALFWAERYHVDGLRVDAVASMLYRDYSRAPGEWLPNAAGGRENLEAVAFLRQMNAAVNHAHPGMMTIAEESTAWPGVSRPAQGGGLGFGFKWNMGFMHDTLAYLAREPVHRPHHHQEIVFGLSYAFSENYMLPLSHDEVVHGKRSLLGKMPGDDWQRFANLRAYYGFLWGHPGKKLLFMGQEFAQAREWSEARPLDWNLLDDAPHAGVRDLVRDLNRAYRDYPALHARDCEPDGFAWLIADDADNAVFAWVRLAPGAAPVAVVANFMAVARHGYRLPLPAAGRWREIVNSDAEPYGGSGVGNPGGIEAADGPGGIAAHVTLPPLATLLLAHDPE